MMGTCSIDEMIGRTQKYQWQLSQSHAVYLKSHNVFLGLKPNTKHQKYDIVMVMSAGIRKVAT